MVYDVYTMKRKQIYIEEEQERELKHLARSRGVPDAVVIREAIGTYLKGRRTKLRKPRTMSEHPLAKIIGIGRSGITDASVNHDFYLYGAPKEEE